MAFRKTLAHRFFSAVKARSAAAAASPACPCSQSRRILSPAGDHPGLLPQRRPFFRAAVPPDRVAAIPTGDNLIERLRGHVGSRIRLDGLVAPPPPPPEAAAAATTIPTAPAVESGMTVAEVKKVLRASQMEAARSRLRAEKRSCVSYSEYLQICCEISSPDQGPGIARSLDESGAVIVLGDAVFLRPEQVAKAIRSVIPQAMAPQNVGLSNELREMVEKKAVIDKKAEAQVRAELWCGLGFIAVQTVGFMRLTFWELSWDVMEPICFFATSIYFMAGYAFFMRTSKDPSFEGFFQSRFAAKQKRLMKAYNFDPLRFDELRSAFPGAAAPRQSSEELPSSPYYCHCNR